MDRFDEKKPDHIDDAPADPEAPVREGDVLGLGGTAVPKSPGDPSAESDPGAAARRRARMREDEAAESGRKEAGTEDTFGATAVDLGAAGKGDTVTRKK